MRSRHRLLASATSKTNIARAKELLRQIESNCIDETYLVTIEKTDTLLQHDMDYRVFCNTL